MIEFNVQCVFISRLFTVESEDNSAEDDSAKANTAEMVEGEKDVAEENLKPKTKGLLKKDLPCFQLR